MMKDHRWTIEARFMIAFPIDCGGWPTALLENKGFVFAVTYSNEEAIEKRQATADAARDDDYVVGFIQNGDYHELPHSLLTEYLTWLVMRSQVEA